MAHRRKTTELLVVADHHFGQLHLSEHEKAVELHGVSLAAGVREALAVAREMRVRVTIAATRPLHADAIALLRRLLPGSPEVVAGADADRTLDSSVAPRLCVAADRVTRNRAVKAGHRALPHLALAAFDLQGSGLRFVRAVGPRESFERLRQFVPYLIEPADDRRIAVFGVLTAQAERRSRDLGIEVEQLGLDLAVEDPLLVRADDPRQLDQLRRCRLLSTGAGRVIVAVPPESLNDDIGLHGEHGHYLFLTPSLDLLTPAPQPRSQWRRARLAMSVWPQTLDISEVPIDPGVLRWILFRCPATAAQFQHDVDRFTGAASLDGAGAVSSRHIRHTDNARVVQALIAELEAIGYCVYTHSFAHAGTTLRSVIADLPGTGLLRVRPNIVELLRELLLTYPWPDPPGPLLDSLRSLGGDTWVREHRFEQRPPGELREAIQKIAALRDWFPWWLRSCPLPGFGAEVVIVGCHLDSTAAFAAGGFDPTTDPAPGADDNASGIAATLAIARYMWQYRDTLPHTVRFCFFNAEEQGLVGSRAYAQHLKATGAPIRAVVCADMIGFNSDANRIFEIHAGYTDPAVRDASVPIANTIAAWAAAIGGLAPAQIYSGTNGASGGDRLLFDGAIGRSDHASFHEQGYPAVVVSEDFFINAPNEPLKDPNPNYHDSDDLVVDAGYAADITCAMARAVTELAGG